MRRNNTTYLLPSQAIGYHLAMWIGRNIQAWRTSRRHSVSALAQKAGVPEATLESIESGELDPPVSTLESLALAIGIPASWLYADPQHLTLLTDTDGSEAPGFDAADPVIARFLSGSRGDRDLYVLLTAVLQSGDPKLVRAAEASLRSLAKQAKQPTVPWQSRPPGHLNRPVTNRPRTSNQCRKTNLACGPSPRSAGRD